MSGPIFLKTVLKWAIRNPSVPRAALEEALERIVDLLPEYEASVEPDLKSDDVTAGIVEAILKHPTIKPGLPQRGGARPLVNHVDEEIRVEIKEKP